MQAARAEDSSPKLIQPAVCSPVKAVPPELNGICEVTPLGNPLLGKQHHKIKVNLTAKLAPIEVGGYTVKTENYNGAYLSPVIEALPGDTVAAHLENLLEPRATDARLTMAHGAPGENPTNLHYFHGGIVTPNNARPPIDAGKGNGDNIYVRLKNREAGEPYSFDYNVPIPGERMLDARVLEGKGTIAHPDGLNWYHSHMHGISSDQVMGGLAGLLSVGEDNANVKAKCEKDARPDKCNKDTAKLKERTIVRYALLQDISLKDISALPGDAPEDANGKTADWAPEQRDFFPDDPPCAPVDPKLRQGYCQRDQSKYPKSAWLFTLNGQRFPTITVGAGRNLLLRIGNLSANVAYWLELYSKSTEKTLPLTILSLDGVVPAIPVDPKRAKIPVDAFDVNDLLLMPASRAEIYVRNDNEEGHKGEQVYILHTKGLDAGADKWPEIQLARIVLEPSVPISSIALALNAPIEKIPSALFGKQKLRPGPAPPDGCVRDLEEGEHRRVTFNEEDEGWSVTTEIVHYPGQGSAEKPEEQFQTSDGTKIDHKPFEAYVQPDHSIDWINQKHVCIRLDHDRSHQQLWVLYNPTSALHNFHIHQMKFRLATEKELKEKYIEPPKPSHTCPDEKCSEPDYKLYEEDPKPGTAESQPTWHDTMPMPIGARVFLIMSFDAAQQIGRFVFHCHILKHEDRGLMAPIEVWGGP